MNRPVDTRPSTLNVLPGLAANPPAIFTPQPRELIKTGVYAGQDKAVFEQLGLLDKKHVGLKPVAPPPSPEALNSPGRAFLGMITRQLASVGYDVNVEYASPNISSLMQGALIGICPHTGLEDPILHYSWLWPIFHAMPLATERFFAAPGVKRLLNGMHALPVPNTDNPVGIMDEIDVLAGQVASGLYRGHNYGLHPAGEILLDGTETIGANSLMAKIVELRPETRVLAVQTFGLNGTEFSRAGNKVEGKDEWHAPSLGKALGSLVGDVAHNLRPDRLVRNKFRLVKERVPVTMRIHDITDEFNAAKTVRDKNAIFERLAREEDPVLGTPTQAYFTPRRVGDERPRQKIESAQRATVEAIEVDPATLARVTDEVHTHLAEITGVAKDELKADQKLADLGLDSMTIVDKVQTWVNTKYGREFASPEAFGTVGDVVGCASGQIPATAGLEPTPVSDVFAAQAIDTSVVGIQPGSRSVLDGFLKAVKADPTRVVAVDDILGEYTYQQLADLVYMLVPEIAKIPETNLGLLFPNSILGTAVQLAVNFAGKTPAMVNPQWNDEQAAAAMKSAKVETVITPQAVIRALKGKREADDLVAVKKGWKTGDEVAVAARTSRTAFPSLEDNFQVIDETMRGLSEWRMADTKLRKGHVMKFLERRAAEVKPNDRAVILFTSGSTGNPKGIAYSHRKVMAGARGLAKRFQVTRGDVMLHMAPSFHLVGFKAAMMSTLMGVPAVNVPNPKAAALAAKTAQIRNATMVVGTPTLVNVMANAAGADGLSSFKQIVMGAEALSTAVSKNIRKAAPNAKLLQGYGATETGVTFAEAFDPANPDDRTLGQPIEGIEYVIVDTEDPTKLVAPGQDGLLLVRGDTVVTPDDGYIGKVPDDAFVVVNGVTYYATGDIAREKQVQGPDGVDVTCVKFVDRASRFSKINGEIVPHGLLENVLKDVLPPTADGTPQCIVVEGNKNANDVPQLIAYGVPGRAANGTAVDANGAPLTFARVHDAIMDTFKGDAKFALSEVRLVSGIEMLGTGKMNLAFYKKDAKAGFEGEVLRR